MGVEVEVVSAPIPPANDSAVAQLRQSAQERFVELFQGMGFADVDSAVDNLFGLFDGCLGSERFRVDWQTALSDRSRYGVYGILGQCLILLDRAECRARVSVPAERLGSYRLQYVAQTSVKTVFALLLERFDGFLVHASGVAINGQGYLFAGASGVGKTSVAQRLAHRAVVLADDAVAVRWDGEVFRAFATPWNLDFPQQSGRRGVARHGVPLAGICFLQQLDRDEAIVLRPEFAGVKLAAQVIPVLRWFEAQQAQRVLDLSVGLCQQTNCCDLLLTREGDVWPLIRNMDKVA
jgi:hypothetical protein